MKIKDFVVVFDRQPAVYYGGGLVGGIARFNLGEDVPQGRVLIHAVGRAFTKYSEMRTVKDITTGRHHSRLLHYGDEEVYFAKDIVVAGETGGDLLQGPHEFRFRFSLPENLPTSFEFKDGSVRYVIRADIDRPHHHTHSVKAGFTVLRELDLNSIPEARYMVEDKNQSQVTTMGCFQSGTVGAAMSIPKRGYVPGETITPTLEVDNSSGKDAVVMVTLDQVIRLTGSRTGPRGPGNVEIHGTGAHHVRTYEKKVSSLTCDPAPAGTVSKLSPALTVPPLPPWHLQGCDVISVEHQVRAHVKAGGSEVTVSCDVIIGTVPLDDQQDRDSFSVHRSKFARNMSECVFGAVNIQEEGENHLHGDHIFTPLYPTYRIAESVTVNPNFGAAALNIV